MTEPSTSEALHAIAVAVANLKLPETASADLIRRHEHEVNRLSVAAGVLASRLKALTLEAEQTEGISPLDPRLVLVHLEKSLPPGADEHDLAARYARWAKACELVGSPPAPVSSPAPMTAPLELTEAEAAALLGIMRDELVRYGVQPTTAETKRTWREFWRREGRRWGRGTPGWGPEEGAADRPPVLAPWA
jgi:hypothetical protein